MRDLFFLLLSAVLGIAQTLCTFGGGAKLGAPGCCALLDAGQSHAVPPEPPPAEPVPPAAPAMNASMNAMPCHNI